MQILLPLMAQGMSPTVIALTLFGVVGDSFALCLLKRFFFNLQTELGYTAFNKYCATVGYDTYLHDDKTDCITENLVA